jgi:KDO2-lipid IV(A) lauroyltransferase
MPAMTKIAEPDTLPAMNWEERRDLAIYRCMRALPVSVVSRLGASLGLRLGRRAHPEADARVVAALERLRPDLARDPKQLRAAQMRLWANVGRVYAEISVLDKIEPGDRVTIAGAEHFDAAMADGRPVIVAYVHLGNWEASAIQMSKRAPGRGCALADPPPANRTRAQIVAMQRSGWPGKVLTIDAMVWRHALKHLEQPGGVMFVAIDEPFGGGMPVPSFGRPLDERGNLGKIVRLAARTGALILPSYCERLDGARFRTHLLAPFEIASGRDAGRHQLRERAAALDALFAPIVLRLIDQWFGLLSYR